MFWVLIKACNGPDGFKSDEINANGTSILSRKNLQGKGTELTPLAVSNNQLTVYLYHVEWSGYVQLMCSRKIHLACQHGQLCSVPPYHHNNITFQETYLCYILTSTCSRSEDKPDIRFSNTPESTSLRAT